jgi:hypothetical protein
MDQIANNERIEHGWELSTSFQLRCGFVKKLGSLNDFPAQGGQKALLSGVHDPESPSTPQSPGSNSALLRQMFA